MTAITASEPRGEDALKIGAIVLAAGEGKRMGGITKCLIRMNGTALITRQLASLSAAGIDEMVVVTGHARQAVENHAKRPGVTLAHNENYTDGQQPSVRIGLATISDRCDAILIALADQPLLGSNDFLELISAFKQRRSSHALIPFVDSQRGNPIVIDQWVRQCVLADEAISCREFMDSNPEWVARYQTKNRHFVTDLDTLQDLERVARLAGCDFALPNEARTSRADR